LQFPQEPIIEIYERDVIGLAGQDLGTGRAHLTSSKNDNLHYINPYIRPIRTASFARKQCGESSVAIS
jgi:hypothetical protein